MKNTSLKFKHLLLISVIFVLIHSCSTVPFSDRQQLILLPSSQMLSMSYTQYDKFLDQHPPVMNTRDARKVENVGKKIATSVERYMEKNDMKNRLKGFKWEFNLVSDDTPNAWCMPGGKVVVYKGILPYTKTEAGLATVMSHEIAHAIARHGNERMSQQLLVQAGGMALNAYLEEKEEESRDIFMAAYGVGSTVGVMLPYSRAHETEADKLGLIFMAMAGYNPEEAVSFWKRMSQSGGQKPPEFLSTHPSDETRIQNLRNFIPEARKYAD
ncbi:MAG: M48 family metallopeptidase [Bacteroidales bacterium]|nr:M48 family metallopeptidase [Bacteroidales bacterium]MCF8333317.1 M48 family metallopeptidase [Bacteroidales bacterium]